MAIDKGQRLPSATLLEKVEGKIGPVDLGALLAGRRVVIFGLPGAFTPTCSAKHVPGFVASAGALAAMGIDAILCVAVNDPHVMTAWAEATGGAAAGIRFLSDADGAFTRALGLDYSAPAAGMFGRSQRYSMLVEDGVVNRLNIEQDRGVCGISSGEAMVEAL